MIKLPISVFLALRYSRSRARSSFTRFISHFVMAGIMLGVTALIIVTSVMNGFENELKTRILGVVPQVTITPATTVASSRIQPAMADWQQQKNAWQWPSSVQHVSPYVQSEGLVQGNTIMRAVMLQGIFPEHEPAQSVLAQSLSAGRLEHLRAGEYRVIIGRPLARQMDVHIGERVRITAAKGQQHTPFGVMPAQRQFTVAGIFEVGADIDSQLIVMHGADAARLFRYPEGHVTGLRLWLDDAFAADGVTATLKSQNSVSDWQIDSWQQRFGQLFAAVRMEKGMMMIMLGLIVAVAAFNAVSALVMLIQDKRGDIAVLQTLGLDRKRLYQTLLLQGMYGGVLGSILGLALGLVVTLSLNGILSVLGISVFSQGMHLPVLINPLQIMQIVAAAMLLTLLATLYPAWRAARLQPAEILRYE
ncbi:lipoprotein-releasing ABC transporter permease subunit [Aliidiomarina sp.]|uniref:lipoprotein-releasing ABC transporter permease subunit n=1 Tax=Aliidiomarina sp. TaxID=1872439 RepID=UPI003A4D22F7